MNMARAATRGAAILTAANLAGYAISFLATLLLARLLTPTEFGQAALVIASVDFLLLLAGWSLPTALIREPEASAYRAFDTALVLTIAMGVLVLGIGAIVASLLWWFNEQLLAELLMSILFGRIVALGAGCFSAELERRFAYARVALLQGGAVAVSVAASVALAVLGAGVWALAARDIVMSGVLLLLSVALSRWRPSWSFDRAKARELVVFGSQMIGSRLGEMLFHRYDNLVVGAIAGSRQLGLYSQSYLLAETGNRIYGPVLQQLPMAVYSRLQGNTRLTARTFDLVSFFLVRVTVPLAALLVLFPSELVSTLFGDQWLAGAPMLRLLVGYALLLPLFDQMRVLLVANGAVAEVLRARVVQLVFFLPAAAIGAAVAGGRGAALAVSVAMVVGTAAILPAARSYGRLEIRDFVKPPIAGAIGALAAIAATASAASPAAVLVRGLPTLLAVYCVALLALDRKRMWHRILSVRAAVADDGKSSPDDPSVPPVTRVMTP
jgi:O-antigen/teichoic acid export membrane protein